MDSSHFERLFAARHQRSRGIYAYTQNFIHHKIWQKLNKR